MPAGSALRSCIGGVCDRRRAATPEPEVRHCDGGEGRNKRCAGALDPISLGAISPEHACCIRPVPRRTAAGDASVLPVPDAAQRVGTGTCMDASTLERATRSRPRSPLYPDLVLSPAQVRHVCGRAAPWRLGSAELPAPPRACRTPPVVLAALGHAHRDDKSAALLLSLFRSLTPVFLVFQDQGARRLRDADGQHVTLGEVLRDAFVSSPDKADCLQYVDLHGSKFRHGHELGAILRCAPGLLWLSLGGVEVDGHALKSWGHVQAQPWGPRFHQECLDRQIQVTFEHGTAWAARGDGIYALQFPLSTVRTLHRLRAEFGRACKRAQLLPGLAHVHVSPALAAH